MMRLLMGSAVLALPLLAAAAPDGDGLALARQKNCLSCHSVDRKMVGPAFKSVADKYRNEPDAKAKLVKVVKEGGKGAWGAIPMPAQRQLSDDEVSTLVNWVLAQ